MLLPALHLAKQHLVSGNLSESLLFCFSLHWKSFEYFSLLQTQFDGHEMGEKESMKTLYFVEVWELKKKQFIIGQDRLLCVFVIIFMCLWGQPFCM